MANSGRGTPSESVAYDHTHFFGKARELEELATKHNHEL